MPDDQAGGFEVAQSSGEHTLRYVSDATAQFPVPMRSFSQREKDSGRPSTDKDRGLPLRPCIVVLFFAGR
jgi:hypothetical protein